jgi:hypothetical protein
MEKKNIILGKEIAKHVCCLKEISTTRLSMLTPIATTIKKKKKKNTPLLGTRSFVVSCWLGLTKRH